MTPLQEGEGSGWPEVRASWARLKAAWHALMITLRQRKAADHISKAMRIDPDYTASFFFEVYRRANAINAARQDPRP